MKPERWCRSWQSSVSRRTTWSSSRTQRDCRGRTPRICLSAWCWLPGRGRSWAPRAAAARRQTPPSQGSSCQRRSWGHTRRRPTSTCGSRRWWGNTAATPPLSWWPYLLSGKARWVQVDTKNRKLLMFRCLRCFTWPGLTSWPGEKGVKLFVNSFQGSPTDTDGARQPGICFDFLFMISSHWDLQWKWPLTKGAHMNMRLKVNKLFWELPSVWSKYLMRAFQRTWFMSLSIIGQFQIYCLFHKTKMLEP